MLYGTKLTEESLSGLSEHLRGEADKLIKYVPVLLERIDANPLDPKLYEMALSCMRQITELTNVVMLGEAKKLQAKINVAIATARGKDDYEFLQRIYKLNTARMLYCAPVSFDDYMLYTESNRPLEKQFYYPRRKQLKVLADALQDLEMGDLELVAISLPPGCGKTTLALFYLTWIAGRHPEKPILTGSHNNAFLRGAYGEVLRMLDPEGDYLWKDVFPREHIISTNAQDMMIDIAVDKKRAKRFTTLEFTSVGSGNAGKVRAEALLYCDDLVDGLESALSKDRMDKLWNMYTTDLRQRKIGACKELHIATRWSLYDVIGRLQSMYGESDRARFIAIPALDENDQSNFDYPIEAGFTTEFYHKQREIMDDPSWRALYMNQPIEREGLLYSSDELRRYFELPEGEPDAIIAVCDTKDRGADYCVMPIAYQYGPDYFIEDVICDDSNPEIVESRLIQKCLQHGIQLARFESNSAGGRIAEKVQSEVKERGGITKITTKFSTKNKETRILAASPLIKDRFLFKDDSIIVNNKEYRRFLNFMCAYTMAGKNKHDDVPDALSMLAEFIESFIGSRAIVMKRIW